MGKAIKNVVQSKLTFAILSIIFIVIGLMSFVPQRNFSNRSTSHLYANKDSIESVKAFMDVYKVLISPRCMNCHPSGDVPLQGDESRLHAMLPRRGKDGRGVYAMKCANCHQQTNLPGAGKPPGHPDWHLPPSNMKMIFQGRTPGQLAKQLVNPTTNGNKNLQQLLEHADDGLVKAGWDPGDGRTQPPLSHKQFKAAWITWIKNGAYAPAGK